MLAPLVVAVTPDSSSVILKRWPESEFQMELTEDICVVLVRRAMFDDGAERTIYVSDFGRFQGKFGLDRREMLERILSYGCDSSAPLRCR